MRSFFIFLSVFFVLAPSFVLAQKNLYLLDGNVSFESRHFLVGRDQHSINDAETLEAELKFLFDDQRHIKFDLRPRVKLDFLDASRNRYLPNTAYASWYSDHVTVNAGFKKNDWGLSEVFRPIDRVNRFDLEHNLFLPEKLGDVMTELLIFFSESKAVSDATLQFFVLPAFFETPLPENDTRYALQGQFGPIGFRKSDDQQEPLSYWRSLGLGASLTAGVYGFDLGLYYYHGPEHQPGYFLTTDGVGALRIKPFYYTIDMVGFTAQKQIKSFGLRVEMAQVFSGIGQSQTHQISGNSDDVIPSSSFYFVPGVEYTSPPFLGKGNLRVVGEYYFQSVQENLVQEFRPLKNDFFVGIHYDLNNSQLTSFSVGLIKDLTHKELLLLASAQSEIIKDLFAQLQFLWVYQDQDPGRPLSFFANNTQISLKLSYRFNLLSSP